MLPPQQEQRSQQQQHRAINTSTSNAILVPPTSSASLPHPSRWCNYYRGDITRLWNSNNNNNDDDGDSAAAGLFSKAGKALQSLFGGGRGKQSEEEQKGIIRRNETKEKISGGIKEFLKDAPLGVRMAGDLVSPILSELASTVAESLVDQQRSMEDVLATAQLYLQNDPDVTRILGGSGTTIVLGSPISQSSSTTSINGQTQSRMELVVPVSDGTGFSYGASTVNISATNNEITRLELNTVSQRIQVNITNKPSQPSQQFTSATTRNNSSTTTTGRTSSSASSYASSSSNSDGDDNIIEAEIIEKDTR